MLCPVVWAQAFLVDMVFAIGKVQSVFCCQHLADLLIPTKVVLVTNRLAVIVHPVEDNMTMWMFTINVPGNDVLRILNAHQLHVVMSDLQHQRVIML